jgi:hypothetical protein
VASAPVRFPHQAMSPAPTRVNVSGVFLFLVVLLAGFLAGGFGVSPADCAFTQPALSDNANAMRILTFNNPPNQVIPSANFGQVLR